MAFAQALVQLRRAKGLSPAGASRRHRHPRHPDQALRRWERTALPRRAEETGPRPGLRDRRAGVRSQRAPHRRRPATAVRSHQPTTRRPARHCPRAARRARAQARSAAMGTGAVALSTKQQRKSKQARHWRACSFVRMAICHTSAGLAGINPPCASTTWRRLPDVLLSCRNTLTWSPLIGAGFCRGSSELIPTQRDHRVNFNNRCIREYETSEFINATQCFRRPELRPVANIRFGPLINRNFVRCWQAPILGGDFSPENCQATDSAVGWLLLPSCKQAGQQIPGSLLVTLECTRNDLLLKSLHTASLNGISPTFHDGCLPANDGTSLIAVSRIRA